MQVKSIAECSKGSILQYFWPSLSYHLSLKPLFYLFLSGCFTQVLFFYIFSVNKQLADKERVAAALENSHLLEVVNQCLDTKKKLR